MPIFQIASFKDIGSESWSNIYHCEVEDLTAAVVMGGAVVATERAVTKNTVHFSRVLVSEVGHPYTNYHTTAIDGQGSVTPTVDMKPLPLWNTVRVEFQTTESGKPDVKQLRIPFYTDEVLDISHMTTTFHTFIQNNYAAPLAALSGLVDKQGHAWASGFTRNEIFDRQLTKRRRKKVVTP